MRLNLKRALSWQHSRLARLVSLLDGWSPMPAAVSFTITGACNLRCEMCTTRSEHPRHMAPDLFASVLRDVRRAFPLRPVVHLIGGEPLLHPQIDLLIREARRLGFPVAMTTNGFLLARKAPTLADLRQVTVSLDGPEEVHDRIRGVAGSFRRAVEGLHAAAGLRRGRLPLLAANCTITPWNVGHLVDTARALQSAPLDSLTFQHLTFGDSDRRIASAVNLVRLRAELDALSGLSSAFPINVFPPLSGGDVEAYYRDSAFPFGRGCLVPWAALRVYEDGTVAPCQDFIVGAIGQQSIRRLWNGPGMAAIRRRIARGNLFKACERCCHRRYYPLAREQGSLRKQTPS
jgi:MoaA/NifB/PqqE/SkfB family radical SAM enzyme